MVLTVRHKPNTKLILILHSATTTILFIDIPCNSWPVVSTFTFAWNWLIWTLHITHIDRNIDGFSQLIFLVPFFSFAETKRHRVQLPLLLLGSSLIVHIIEHRHREIIARQDQLWWFCFCGPPLRYFCHKGLKWLFHELWMKVLSWISFLLPHTCLYHLYVLGWIQIFIPLHLHQVAGIKPFLR